MFNTIGYNFCRDINALDPLPTSVNALTNTEIRNGIFDHMNITRKATEPCTPGIPVWEYETIFDCDFNNNIQGGNINFQIETISSLVVKRRKAGEFDWITFFDIPIEKVEDLSWVRFDYYAQNGIEYEYAIVPSFHGNEGNYAINSVLSEFNGTFICDKDDIYKFYTGVQFGAGEQINKTQVFEPLGSKYPVVISNGKVSYYRSSLSGSIFSVDSMESRLLDPLGNMQEKNKVVDFLTKKRAKIIKDWNGNIYLALVVDNISILPSNEVSGAYTDITFSYVENGNPNSEADLVKSALLDNIRGV